MRRLAVLAGLAFLTSAWVDWQWSNSVNAFTSDGSETTLAIDIGATDCSEGSGTVDAFDLFRTVYPAPTWEIVEE